MSVVATEMLYRRHAPRVFRYCNHYLRRSFEAEDALQQTFLQAHRALDRGVEPVSEEAWLLTIARNVCLTRIDAAKRQGRFEVAQDPDLIANAAGAADTTDDDSPDVHAALSRLPERQRRALYLREWYGLSYAEIAAEMDTRTGAVETLLFRARESLASQLGRRRRALDLAAPLGWVRSLLAPAAPKIAAGIAVAVAATAGPEIVQHTMHSALQSHSRARVGSPVGSDAASPRSFWAHAAVPSRPRMTRLSTAPRTRTKTASPPRRRHPIPPASPVSAQRSAALASATVPATARSRSSTAATSPTTTTTTAALPSTVSSAPAAAAAAVQSLADTVTTAVGSAVSSVSQTVASATQAAVTTTSALASQVTSTVSPTSASASTSNPLADATQAVSTSTQSLSSAISSALAPAVPRR